ncbi:MAG: hypothetical protein E6I75_16260 [Chloroflexi bacterium]|nr:MAG: hypothetical protein E6I75_16260 [Chloroflexota bacterium]
MSGLRPWRLPMMVTAFNPDQIAAMRGPVRRRRVFAVLVFGAFLSILVSACQASQSGAAGGSVPLDATRPALGLAVDPTDGSLLKVGGGVFKSADQGKTWSALPVPAALQPTALQEIETTTAAPGALLAAGRGAGVLRSDDAGQTWSAADSGLPSKDVAAFAVHSFHPGTLYAWIDGRGVFRTDDGGATWEKMDEGPPGTQVIGLAHSTLPGSMNTGWLYASTASGPYISMDCF